MDKSCFSVTSGFDDSIDKEYWKNQDYIARLQSMEMMRIINYGYDPLTSRLQRILKITELKKS